MRPCPSSPVWALLGASALGLFLAGGPAAASETWREQSRLRVEGEGLERVVVHNDRGRIEARPSADRDLHVTALKIVRAADREDAQAAARRIVVELSREDRRYIVRVRYPRRRSVHVNVWEGLRELSYPRQEVRLVLEVPRGVGVEFHGSSADLVTASVPGPQWLEAVSGDVEVEGAADVRISTSSGDVRVAGARSLRVRTVSGDVEVPEVVRGPLSVRTSSGDIELAGTPDTLEAESVSGDIVAQRAARGARVRSSSGEVVLRRASGQVTVRTISGEVRAGLAAPLQGATLTTSSGDIRLGLLGDIGCEVDLETSSGSVDLELPARTRASSSRHMTAVVREGGPPVSLRSVSGSITVTAGEP